MEVKVELNNLRIAPRKSREVVDLVRGKNIPQARAALEFTVKRASESVLKLLNSAVASALNDLKLKESDLYISKITVDEGPKLKRIHMMSRGRAYPIMKRTSHITLVLSDETAGAKPKTKKPVLEADQEKPQPPMKPKKPKSKKNLKS